MASAAALAADRHTMPAGESAAKTIGPEHASVEDFFPLARLDCSSATVGGGAIAVILHIESGEWRRF